jgi:hypothetical protein
MGLASKVILPLCGSRVELAGCGESKLEMFCSINLVIPLIQNLFNSLPCVGSRSPGAVARRHLHLCGLPRIVEIGCFERPNTSWVVESSFVEA